MEPASTVEIDGLSEVVAGPAGEIAYGALRSGYVVVDVSDPTDPEILAERRGLLSEYDGGPLERVYDVNVSGDRLLVAGPNGGSGLSGFVLVDVSDPASPEQVAVHLTDHAIHNAFLDGDTAYLTGVGGASDPVVVVDVSDDDPEEVARWDPTDVDREGGNCHDLYVQDGVLYVAYWDAGTWLLDVSDPADPAPIARVRNRPEGDTDGGFGGLPGNSHYVQPSPDGRLLAVGREAWNDPSTDAVEGPGPVDVFDVSDPTSPTHLTTLAPPPSPENERGETAHNLGWREDRLYVAWYGGGVRVYDLADPTAPRILGRYRESTASFWTAKPTANGFLGSSFYDPTLDDRDAFVEGTGAVLYSFDRLDGSGDPARTTDPVGTFASGTVTRTPSGEPTTTARTTAGPTTAATTAPTTAGGAATDAPTTDGGVTTTDGGATPGFGLLAALAGGTLAGWRLRRERDGE